MEDNLRFSKHKEIKGKTAYDRYNNYDAIEVPFTDAIPGDYDGMMGVPITFLDKYSPDQFEIMGYEYSDELRTKNYPVKFKSTRRVEEHRNKAERRLRYQSRPGTIEPDLLYRERRVFRRPVQAALHPPPRAAHKGEKEVKTTLEPTSPSPTSAMVLFTTNWRAKGCSGWAGSSPFNRSTSGTISMPKAAARGRRRSFESLLKGYPLGLDLFQQSRRGQVRGAWTASNGSPVSDGSLRTSSRSWITAIRRTSTACPPTNKPRFGTLNC